MSSIRDILRNRFPEHTNFQPHVPIGEVDILRNFHEKWSKSWRSNRGYLRAERGGGLVSDWPCVELGDGWFALETDDGMEFTDITFYKQSYLVKRWFFRIPSGLTRFLTVHYRGHGFQCNPAELQRAYSLGLKSIIFDFISAH